MPEAPPMSAGLPAPRNRLAYKRQWLAKQHKGPWPEPEEPEPPPPPSPEHLDSVD